MRYPIYSQIVEETAEQWHDECLSLMSTFLAVWLDQTSIQSGRKELTARYKKLMRKTKEQVTNMGVLGVNHFLGIASVLGIIPLCYYDCVAIDASPSHFKIIEREFRIEKKVGVISNLLKTFTHALGEKIGAKFTIQFAENVICKVFRKKSGAERKVVQDDELPCRFSDVIFETQTVFQVVPGGVELWNCWSQNSIKPLCVTAIPGPIFSRWSLNGEFTSTLSLASECFLGGSFECPTKLGRANRIERPTWHCDFPPVPLLHSDGLREYDEALRNFH